MAETQRSTCTVKPQNSNMSLEQINLITTLLEDDALEKTNNYKMLLSALRSCESIDAKIAERIFMICNQDLIENAFKNVSNIASIISVLLEKIQNNQCECEESYLRVSAMNIITILPKLRQSLTKTEALRKHCYNTLLLYPDDIYVYLADEFRSLNDLIMSCASSLFDITYIFSLLQRTFKILPPDKRSCFVKEGTTLWFSIIPNILHWLTENPKQENALLVNVFETLTDDLVYFDYKDNIKWNNILQHISQVHKYPALLKSLLENGNNQWHRLWMIFIKLLKQQIIKVAGAGGSPINSMLPVVENAFKLDVTNRCRAFECWNVLIDNFSSATNDLVVHKKIKLLIIPLKSNNAKVEETILAKFNTWWHLIRRFSTVLNKYVDSILIPFLYFCFGKHTAESLSLNPNGQHSNKSKQLCVQALVELFGHHVDCNICTDIPLLSTKSVGTQNIVNYWKDWMNSYMKAVNFMCSNYEDKNKQRLLCLTHSFLSTLGVLPDNNVRRDLLDNVLEMWIILMKEENSNTNLPCIILDVLIPSLVDNKTNKLHEIFYIKHQNKTAVHKIVMEIIKMAHKLLQRCDSKTLVIKLKPLVSSMLEEWCKTFDNILDSLARDYEQPLIIWTIIAETLVKSRLTIITPESWHKSLKWPLMNSQKCSTFDNKYASFVWLNLYEIVLNIKTSKLHKDVLKLLLSNGNSINFRLTAALALSSNTSFTDSDKALEVLNDIISEVKTYEEIDDLIPLLLDKIPVLIKIAKPSSSKYNVDILKSVMRLVNNEYKSHMETVKANNVMQAILKQTEVLINLPQYKTFLPAIVDEVINTYKIFEFESETKETVLKLLELLSTNINEECIISKIKNTLNQSKESVTINETTANEFVAPNIDKPGKAKINKEFCVVDTVIVDGEKFVVKKPNWKFNLKNLTENQKEKFCRKREDIPALYQDLSQSQDEFKNKWVVDTQDTSSTSSMSNNKTTDGDKLSEKKNTILYIPDTDIVPNIMENLMADNAVKKEDSTFKKDTPTPKSNKSPRMALKDRVFRNVRNLLENSSLNKEPSSVVSKEDNTAALDTPAVTENSSPRTPNNRLKTIMHAVNAASACKGFREKQTTATADIDKTPISKVNNNDILKSAPAKICTDRPTRAKRKPKKYDDTQLISLKRRKHDLSQNDFQSCSQTESYSELNFTDESSNGSFHSLENNSDTAQNRNSELHKELTKEIEPSCGSPDKSKALSHDISQEKLKDKTKDGTGIKYATSDGFQHSISKAPSKFEDQSQRVIDSLITSSDFSGSNKTTTNQNESKSLLLTPSEKVIKNVSVKLVNIDCERHSSTLLTPTVNIETPDNKKPSTKKSTARKTRIENESEVDTVVVVTPVANKLNASESPPNSSEKDTEDVTLVHITCANTNETPIIKKNENKRISTRKSTKARVENELTVEDVEYVPLVTNNPTLDDESLPINANDVENAEIVDIQHSNETPTLTTPKTSDGKNTFTKQPRKSRIEKELVIDMITSGSTLVANNDAVVTRKSLLNFTEKGNNNKTVVTAISVNSNELPTFSTSTLVTELENKKVSSGKNISKKSRVVNDLEIDNLEDATSTVNITTIHTSENLSKVNEKDTNKKTSVTEYRENSYENPILSTPTLSKKNESKKVSTKKSANKKSRVQNESFVDKLEATSAANSPETTENLPKANENNSNNTTILIVNSGNYNENSTLSTPISNMTPESKKMSTRKSATKKSRIDNESEVDKLKGVISAANILTIDTTESLSKANEKDTNNKTITVNTKNSSETPILSIPTLTPKLENKKVSIEKRTTKKSRVANDSQVDKLEGATSTVNITTNDTSEKLSKVNEKDTNNKIAVTEYSENFHENAILSTLTPSTKLESKKLCTKNSANKKNEADVEKLEVTSAASIPPIATTENLPKANQNNSNNMTIVTMNNENSNENPTLSTPTFNTKLESKKVSTRKSATKKSRIDNESEVDKSERATSAANMPTIDITESPSKANEKDTNSKTITVNSENSNKNPSLSIPTLTKNLERKKICTRKSAAKKFQVEHELEVGRLEGATSPANIHITDISVSPSESPNENDANNISFELVNSENSEDIPTAVENNSSRKKKKPLKSRIVSQLAIDTVEGHPLLAKQNSKRNRKKLIEFPEKAKSERKPSTPKSEKKSKTKDSIDSLTVTEAQEKGSEECSEDVIESSQDSSVTTISVSSAKRSKKCSMNSEKSVVSQELSPTNCTQSLLDNFDDTTLRKKSRTSDGKDDTVFSQNKIAPEEELNTNEINARLDTEPMEQNSEIIIINDDLESPIVVNTEDTEEIATADTQPMDSNIFDKNSQHITASLNTQEDVTKTVTESMIIDITDKDSDMSPDKDEMQRKQDFLNNTFDISPIKIQSPLRDQKTPSPDTTKDFVIKLTSPVNSNGEPLEKSSSPEIFSEDKTPPVERDQSPPREDFGLSITSPSASLSLKKNRPQVRTNNRALQMLGLCVSNKIESSGNLDKSFEASEEPKRITPVSTPVRKNLKMIYNAVADDEMIDESEDSENFLKFKKSLPAVDSSPAGPILKRKLVDIADESTISPASKRKRVSFHDPPVSTILSVQKYIEPGVTRSPQNTLAKRKEREAQKEKNKSNMKSPKRLDTAFKLDTALTKAIESFSENDSTITSTNNTPLSSLEQTPILQISRISDLDDKNPICLNLVDCIDPISKIALELSSPAMHSLLIKEFEGKIETIGDLARLTELDVYRLHIKSPKVPLVKKVLKNYLTKLEAAQSEKTKNQQSSEINKVPDSETANVGLQTEAIALNSSCMQTDTVTTDDVNVQTNIISLSTVSAQTVESGCKSTAEIVKTCISEKPDFIGELNDLLDEKSKQKIAETLPFESLLTLFSKKTNSENSMVILDQVLNSNSVIGPGSDSKGQLLLLQNFVCNKFDSKELILFCTQLLQKVYDKK